MKIAIDSYSYHRFFGDWYPELQSDPGRRMSVWDFVDTANRLGVEGVSLESCYLGDLDEADLLRLHDTLNAYGLKPVWAWGHPDGLGSGRKVEAVQDVVRNLAIARTVGADVMRICAGGRRTRPASWSEHKEMLLPLLRELIGPAEEHGVVLAIENHIDLLADELLELLTTIDSPWLGVCLDTANNLRMGEDPVEVAQKLAPWTRATHIKDVRAHQGDPSTFAYWPSVPLGQGQVDLPTIVKLLAEQRYRGLLALEIDYLHPDYPDEDSAIGESLAFLGKLLTESGAQ